MYRRFESAKQHLYTKLTNQLCIRCTTVKVKIGSWLIFSLSFSRLSLAPAVYVSTPTGFRGTTQATTTD
jgi:hypothetical protein